MSEESSRLVEYIALYEPDASCFRHTSAGLLLAEDAKIPAKVSLKFPVIDHKQIEFPPSLDLFIFPNGIQLKTYRPHTSSHSFVCTLVDGKRLFAYCVIEWSQLPSERLSTVKMQIAARLIHDHVDPRYLLLFNLFLYPD